MRGTPGSDRSSRLRRTFCGAFWAACLQMLVAGCDDRANDEARPVPPSEGTVLVRTAERDPVTLTVRIDRSTVSVPETLSLTVTVDAEIGVDVTLPDIGETFGEFGVADMTEAEPVQDDVLVRRERTYTLETFLHGSFSIPPVTVEFADRREKADGSRTEYRDAVATEPIPVLVEPGLADIKAPATLRMPGWQKLLAWGIVVLAGMVATALLARWWRRRKRKTGRKPRPAPRVPAHEWALRELDKLAAEDLIGRGLIQEYYYRINALLRRYIELRFGLMAGEQTSEEFVRALQDSLDFEEVHREVLQRFVKACDPVKYARYRPDSQEIDWVHAAARDFVLETAQTEANGRLPAGETRASSRRS